MGALAWLASGNKAMWRIYSEFGSYLHASGKKFRGIIQGNVHIFW